MAEIRFIRYLTIDTGKTLAGIRLDAGLLLEVVGSVPVASLGGRYRDVIWEPQAMLCEIPGRPGLRIAVDPEMVSEQCPLDAVAEGMARPGHIYEWEKTR